MERYQDGLICSYILNGTGGGRQVSWDEIATWHPEMGYLWIHLDRRAEGISRWLREESGLDPIVVDALLEEETRPRSAYMGTGLVVILRGVNSNPGAEPEDLVSIRMWVDEHRVISMRAFRMMAVRDLRDMLAVGAGPINPSSLMVRIADKLVDRMGPVIEQLNDTVDDLEDELIISESSEVRSRLGGVRRQAIAIRRYLAPQREAMIHLHHAPVSWISDRDRGQLREVTDQVVRYVEDLDSIRERAAVVQDELTNRMSEQMSRSMYRLSVLAALILPVSFVASLLGINVGGIPGAGSPHGFWAVCGIMAALVGLQVAVFRLLKWL